MRANEAASRAGMDVDPPGTGVVSGNTTLRSGADSPYPECVRALGAAEAAALGERYIEHLRSHSTEAARISDKLPGNYLHLGFIATILPGPLCQHR